MPDLTDPRPTRLEGFDAHGIIVGSAEWSVIDQAWWLIRVGGMAVWDAPAEPEARALLRQWGATEIKESGGKS